MSDAKLREKQRKSASSIEDEAVYLNEKVRIGKLHEADLRIAAYAGHEAAAIALFGTAEATLYHHCPICAYRNKPECIHLKNQEDYDLTDITVQFCKINISKIPFTNSFLTTADCLCKINISKIPFMDSFLTVADCPICTKPLLTNHYYLGKTNRLPVYVREWFHSFGSILGPGKVSKDIVSYIQFTVAKEFWNLVSKDKKTDLMQLPYDVSFISNANQLLDIALETVLNPSVETKSRWQKSYEKIRWPSTLLPEPGTEGMITACGFPYKEIASNYPQYAQEIFNNTKLAIQKFVLMDIKHNG